MKLLITGGAGYIGSITNKILMDRGYETVVFDNLSTGHKDAVYKSKLFIGDLKNPNDLKAVFENDKFDAVIHFAALALAGESMEKPYAYYENNILGGLNLLEAMRKSDCKTIIFSSTCAVYGFPDHLPVSETESFKPVSVYGSSKRMFEEIIEWYEKIYGIKHAFLRYFNAAGALLDGSLGEEHPIETHIIPIAMDVALGKKSAFKLFGNDYKTSDGSCVRDYIHILDLADAHVRALDYVKNKQKSVEVNLGVGKGYSNLEILREIEKITGKNIPVEYVSRRSGDPDSIYADNSKAKTLLEWVPQYSDISTIVQSAWKWHTRVENKSHENRD
jgi:UDP-glucose 4-epimerase